MQDVCYIEDLDRAMTLLKPQRLEILRRMDTPRTCPELADYFDESAQKIYYHVKALETARLVEKVEEKRVRGAVEGYYQASARSYWLAPTLVGQIGTPTQARDQMSLRVLLGLAEEVIEDTGKLGSASALGTDVPSLSLSAHIHLPDARRRAEFLTEVQAVFQQLATKYGLPETQTPVITDEQDFRLVLMCYPKPDRPSPGKG
ncbi:MAG TPA: helix-turn-helix domain-containing protein [Aggregatilineales bacterium]|nr:helix-turn-helix domain-containing protein [Aggregatilineales bacterium]